MEGEHWSPLLCPGIYFFTFLGIQKFISLQPYLLVRMLVKMGGICNCKNATFENISTVDQQIIAARNLGYLLTLARGLLNTADAVI